MDASGENVWWHVDRAREWPSTWERVRVKKRQIAFAWGPRREQELQRTSALEITISAAEGGTGTIFVAGLELVAMPPLVETSAPPRADADADQPGHPAAAAVDGDERTAWRPAPAAAGSPSTSAGCASSAA